MTGDHLVIYTAQERLLKTILSSGSEFSHLVRRQADYIEKCHATTTKTEKKSKRQKELVSVRNTAASEALNDVASLRQRVAAAVER